MIENKRFCDTSKGKRFIIAVPSRKGRWKKLSVIVGYKPECVFRAWAISLVSVYKTPSASIKVIVELDFFDLISLTVSTTRWDFLYSCWLNLNSIRPCISSLLCSQSSSSFYTFPNGILSSFLSPLHDENPGHAWHFSSPKPGGGGEGLRIWKGWRCSSEI